MGRLEMIISNKLNPYLALNVGFSAYE